MSVDDTFQPIVLKSAKKDPAEIEMIPVFEIDGEWYQVPKKPSAGMALGYLKKQSTEGPDAAVYWMMVELFGEEGYEALATHPELDRDDLTKIIEFLERLVLGGDEANPTTAGGGTSRHRVSKN